MKKYIRKVRLILFKISENISIRPFKKCHKMFWYGHQIIMGKNRKEVLIRNRKKREVQDYGGWPYIEIIKHMYTCLQRKDQILHRFEYYVASSFTVCFPGVINYV